LDGTNWIGLGEASRILGGWQVENPSLLSSIAIRARAYAPAGFNNGSAQFVETTLRPLKILNPTGTSGLTSNTFSFFYGGPPGLSVVIESSADFQTWLPLRTNVLGVGISAFNQTNQGTLTHEFFRLRIP
jgi:hypothetical protein